MWNATNSIVILAAEIDAEFLFPSFPLAPGLTKYYFSVKAEGMGNLIECSPVITLIWYDFNHGDGNLTLTKPE